MTHLEDERNGFYENGEGEYDGEAIARNIFEMFNLKTHVLLFFLSLTPLH